MALKTTTTKVRKTKQQTNKQKQTNSRLTFHSRRFIVIWIDDHGAQVTLDQCSGFAVDNHCVMTFHTGSCVHQHGVIISHFYHCAWVDCLFAFLFIFFLLGKKKFREIAGDKGQIQVHFLDLIYLDWKLSSGWLESWEGLLLATDVSTTCADSRQQQSFPALQSPRWSLSIKVCYSWVQTIFLFDLICCDSLWFAVSSISKATVFD